MSHKIMHFVNYFMNDYVGLLSLLVLIGAVILFLVVLINIFQGGTDEEEALKKEEDGGEDDYEETRQFRSPAKPKEEETSEDDVLVTFLKSISDDLADIKQKINVLMEAKDKQPNLAQKDTIDAFSEQLQAKLKNIEIEELAKQTKDINAKLGAMYKVLSRIAESDEKNEP